MNWSPPWFDLDRFIKLMLLTTSEHDGECLNAIRKANAMLLADNLNWREFAEMRSGGRSLDQHEMKTVYDAGYKDGRRAAAARANPRDGIDDLGHINPDETEIGRMLRHLLDTVPAGSSFRTFVEDVHRFYDQHGYVTGRQHDAIRRSYENSQRGRG